MKWLVCNQPQMEFVQASYAIEYCNASMQIGSAFPRIIVSKNLHVEF